MENWFYGSDVYWKKVKYRTNNDDFVLFAKRLSD